MENRLSSLSSAHGVSVENKSRGDPPAATALVEREGEAALTLRRLAGELGVAPNALYRYYPSREALVAAVGDEAARALHEAQRVAVQACADVSAEGRCRAAMRAYVAFAEAHPALYETSMRSNSTVELSPPAGHDFLWSSALALLEPLTGREAAPAAAVTLWSLLHGLFVLRRARLVGGQKPSEIADFAIETLLRGLRG